MKENLGCETDVCGIKMFTKCDECHYMYNDEICINFRADHYAKLGFVMEG